MRPHADEVLRSAIWSFEKYILPSVTEPLALSYAHSVKNLLRNVLLRMEHEAPAVHAANQRLEVLLEEIRKDFPSLSLRSETAENQAPHGGEQGADFLTYKQVLARQEQLHGHLDRVIQALNDQPADVQDGYVELHEKIRRHLRSEVDAESSWVVPAFSGPRR